MLSYEHHMTCVHFRAYRLVAVSVYCMSMFRSRREDGKSIICQCVKTGNMFGDLGSKAMQVVHQLYLAGGDVPFLEGVKIALSESCISSTSAD